MLGQPALLARQDGRDAQGKALLAEQRVAAVARAVAPDGAFLGEVDDVLLRRIRVARPRYILLARFERATDRMKAMHKLAVTQRLYNVASHAGHDAHVDGHIGRVGQFDADVGDWRTNRPHAERNHVHGAAAHAAVKAAAQFDLHVARVHPVVGGAGIFAAQRADEGAIFDAGDVAWVGAGEKAVGALFLVEADEGAALHHQIAQAVVLFLGAIAPVYLVRLTEVDHFIDPTDQFSIFHVLRDHIVLHGL